MVSDIEKAKRALIAVLRSLSLLYNCGFDISRESVDTAITKAYRSLSRKVHPDKGGRPGDQTRLNAAHDVWTDALKNRGTRGRPQGAQGNTAEAAAVRSHQRFFVLPLGKGLAPCGAHGKCHLAWVRLQIHPIAIYDFIAFRFRVVQNDIV